MEYMIAAALGRTVLALAVFLGLAYIVRWTVRESETRLRKDLLRWMNPEALHDEILETWKGVSRLEDAVKALALSETVERSAGKTYGTWMSVRRLENSVKALSKSMEGSVGELNEIGQAVSRLEGRMDPLSRDIASTVEERKVTAVKLKDLRDGVRWIEDRVKGLSETVEGRGEGAEEITAALRSLDERGKFLAEGLARCEGKLNSVLEAALRSDDRIRGVSAEQGRGLEELKESALTVEELRRGMEIVLERGRVIDQRLERMEKWLSDWDGPAVHVGSPDRADSSGQAAPADGGSSAETALPAEREAEMSREMEEGVMNLLRYAAGKVPGVEVST